MPPYDPKLLIDQIRTDKVHGADWLSNAAVSVIATASLKESAKTVDELHEVLWGYAIELAGCRPSMAPLVNKLGIMFNRLDGIDEIREYRARSTEIAGDILEESNNSKVRMVEHLKTVAADPGTIFTYSYSSTVKQAILGLGAENVIVTESRPGNEGITLAKELAEEGVNVLTGVDGMVHMYMKAADVVLVGADSVQHDGSFINKVGTKMLGYAAREFGVPFYVLCDTMKFNVLNYLGQEIELEEMNPEEVVEPSDNLRVRNFYFEVIPTELVTAFITEEGIMESIDIKKKMEELRKQVEPLLNPKH
jgi:translation initiation factor 2B subunit (eIF-2B alpha/beta/delta family)